MTTGTSFSRKRSQNGIVPLAFSFEVDPKGSKHEITVVEWTDDAIRTLKILDTQFRDRKPKQSLPTRSLRMQISIGDIGIRRLDKYLGLGKRKMSTIAWTDTNPDDAKKHFHNAIMHWIVSDLSYAADSSMDQPLQRIKRMARAEQLLSTECRVAHVFDWSSTRSGTTAPGTTNLQGYSDLADFVARQLEGHELFHGLGVMKRVVSRDLMTNHSVLMTQPITIPRRNTTFSLIVTFKVLSFPGRNTPIVVLECSKRRWLHNATKTTGHSLKAFALPTDWNVALEFSLQQQRWDLNNPHIYEPDPAFTPIARRFGLDLDMSGQQILEEGFQNEDCPLLVAHNQYVREKPDIKAGVPDHDKLEAFQHAAKLLAPWGLEPWQGLAEVKTDSRPIRDRNQKWRRNETIGQWQKEMRKQIALCFGTSHHIVIGYHPNYYRDAQQVEDRLRKFLGGSIRVQLLPIPLNVHGPRKVLPQSSSAKPQNRARSRADAWQPFLEQVQRYMYDTQDPIDGVLVIAPKWYELNGRPAPDDVVNKRAGRITIAQQLRVPVQYLRPSCEGNRPVPDFETRTIVAWLDLAWKTQGRIDTCKLKQITCNIYADRLSGQPQAPNRLLALGILRQNRTRQRANQSSFVPVSIELDVQTGTCWARFARRKAGGGMDILPKKPLVQAIADLAESGPITLGADKMERRKDSESFFYKVITDFCRRISNPLVIIDANTCRDVWSWLTDSKLDPENVIIDGHLHAEADWGNARIVRVRTDNAPKVLLDGKVIGSGLNTDRNVEYAAPKSVDAQIFRVDDSVGDIYLSFGSLLRTGLIQGVSCFRPAETLKLMSKDKREKLNRKEKAFAYKVENRLPYTGDWSTPSGVEFTVVRTAPDENSEELVRLIEGLRTGLCLHTGDWTTKPVPFVFVDVLKEYLADYNLEEETGTEDAELSAKL